MYRTFPLCLLLFFACQTQDERKGPPYIYVADDFSEIAVESTPNMDSLEANRRFQVFLLNEQKEIPDDQNPVTGRLRIKNGRISFVPGSTLKSGKTYRARFQTGKMWLERDFYVMSPDGKAATYVEEAYPSMPFIPQNIRKFHIHFSDSMARGHVAENIYMTDEYGAILTGVFPKDMQEQWSANMKQLTLELPPIYMKSPAVWREELNARFTIFKNYRLVIDKGMRDANNRPLTHGYYREYRVYMPTRSKANSFGIVGTPAAGTQVPVILRSGKPIEIGSMKKYIYVTDREGESVSGMAEIDDYEQRWTFTPSEPWEIKEYQIRVKDKIEDLAGNTRRDLFDNRDTLTLPPGIVDYYPFSFWPK